MPPKSTLPLRSDSVRYLITSNAPLARPSIARSRFVHVTSVDPNATLEAAVRQDHAELKRAYDNYKAATTEDGKTKWGNQFVWEMTRHALGEVLVVYPGKMK